MLTKSMKLTWELMITAHIILRSLKLFGPDEWRDKMKRKLKL